MDLQKLQKQKIVQSPPFAGGVFFDKDFKIYGTHKFIFNFARQRGGVFNLEEYRKHLQNGGIEPKMLKQMLVWEQTTLKKLETAGYVKNVGTGNFQLLEDAVAWAERPKPRPDFKLGKNHVKLLEKHTDGVIKSVDLKAEHKDKPQHEYNRQSKMIDGMIKSLVGNGYLTRIDKGTYTLTEYSMNVVAQVRVEAEIAKAVREVKKGEPNSKVYEFKITEYDRHVLSVADENGYISKELLAKHEKGESIAKRIKTLERAGLIVDSKITDSLKIRINTAVELRRTRSLMPEMLTKPQTQVLRDMALFSNLTPKQILIHIYKGKESLFQADMSLLERKGILDVNTTWGCYILKKDGVRLLRQISPDSFYKSKIYSKSNEVGHDILVYSAFKQMEKRIVDNGGKITFMQNDRMIRSEYVKQFGYMSGQGEFPDLKVTYTDKHGMEVVEKLEVDAGYDAKTIGQKLSAFFSSSGTGSFTWTCKTVGQAVKVAGLASLAKSKSLKKHKALYINFIDNDGNIQNMRWS